MNTTHAQGSSIETGKAVGPSIIKRRAGQGRASRAMGICMYARTHVRTFAGRGGPNIGMVGHVLVHGHGHGHGIARPRRHRMPLVGGLVLVLPVLIAFHSLVVQFRLGRGLLLLFFFSFLIWFVLSFIGLIGVDYHIVLGLSSHRERIMPYPSSQPTGFLSASDRHGQGGQAGKRTRTNSATFS